MDAMEAGGVIRFPEIERVEERGASKMSRRTEKDGFCSVKGGRSRGAEPSIEGVQLALSTIDFRF